MMAEATQRCARCGRFRADWQGSDGKGFWRMSRSRVIQVYCCSGCALGRCTCSASPQPRAESGDRAAPSRLATDVALTS